MRKLFILIFIGFFAAGWGQTVTLNPLCYGQPIELNCSFLIGGCGGMQSTYRWENFSGSWTSNLPNPTIYVGEVGYASNRFYLSIQYAPPQGGFSAGRVTVGDYPKILVTGVVTPVTCFGSNDGTITLTTSGGNFPLSYLWSDGATTKNRTGLTAGSYTVTVTDGKGCTNLGSGYTPATYTVATLTPLSILDSISHQVCVTSCDGYAEITVSGGTPLYGYLWSNGNTTNAISGLCAGDYSVTVTDSKSCFIQDTLTVLSLGCPFDVLVVKKNLRCQLEGSGAVNLIPDTPGTYTYLWEDGDTNCIKRGLSSGDYYITVTNSHGYTCVKHIVIFKDDIMDCDYSLSIATESNLVCYGDTVIISIEDISSGSSPLFYWIKNGVAVGNGQTDYSFNPSDGDNVWCVMKSGCWVYSDTITFSVIGPASISIDAISDSVCPGVYTTLTTTYENEGSSPEFHWYLNGTLTATTSDSYTFLPTNGDTVFCTLKPSECDVVSTSNQVVTLVKDTSYVINVSIWTDKYAVPTDSIVQYYSNISNGGSSPGYQWLKNGIIVSGATNSTYSYAPINDDDIQCVVTSSLVDCKVSNPDTSNVINMIVYTTGTPCIGAETVEHGSRIYNSVQIGTQCWLRENINIGNMILNDSTQSDNSIVEKYCYNNDTNNCNIYGGLYQWAEMVQYLNNVTNTTHWPNPQPTNVQGVCPTGWHIPTTAEVDVLKSYLGSTTAAGQLKETGTVHWRANNVGATNSTGFTSLPHGHVYAGAFAMLKEYANFWTITKGQTNNDAYYRGTAYNFASMTEGQGLKTSGIAVRCIKD